MRLSEEKVMVYLSSRDLGQVDTWRVTMGLTRSGLIRALVRQAIRAGGPFSQVTTTATTPEAPHHD